MTEREVAQALCYLLVWPVLLGVIVGAVEDR